MGIYAVSLILRALFNQAELLFLSGFLMLFQLNSVELPSSQNHFGFFLSGCGFQTAVSVCAILQQLCFSLLFPAPRGLHSRLERASDLWYTTCHVFVCAFLEGSSKGVWGRSLLCQGFMPREPRLQFNPLWCLLVSHALLELHLDLILGVEGSSSSPEHYCDKYWYWLYGKIILCSGLSRYRSLVFSTEHNYRWEIMNQRNLWFKNAVGSWSFQQKNIWPLFSGKLMKRYGSTQSKECSLLCFDLEIL